MVYLSPVLQWVNKTFFYRNTQENINYNYVTLIIPTGGLLSLKIDDTLWSSLADTYSYAHPNLAGYSVVVKRWIAAKGIGSLQSDSAFTGINYGLGTVESYAYNAGAQFQNLDSLNNILTTRLLSFNAEKYGSANLLQWTTSNEINAVRFDVEWSVNGIEFNKKGEVKAGKSSYNFTDNNPVKGINYYRLKMVDKDGRYEYSPVRKVINSDNSFYVALYPNPVKENVQLHMESETACNMQFNIAGVEGKILLTKSALVNEGASLTTMNIDALQKGSYFITITASNRERLVLKFVKL